MSRARSFLIVLVIAVSDIATKSWARRLRAPWPWEHWVYFEHFENRGFALGVFADTPTSAVIALDLAWLMLLLAWIAFRSRAAPRFEVIGVLLWFSGLLANAIDFLWHGAVEDFIATEVHIAHAWYGINWNLADVFVCGGFTIYVAAAVRRWRSRRPAAD